MCSSKSRRVCRQLEQSCFSVHGTKLPCKRAAQQRTLAEQARAPGRGSLKREGGARAGRGAFTRAPSVSFVAATAPRPPAATRGLFVYKRITSAPPSLPGPGTRPLALFPPPPAPNLLASQWCDLPIGWTRPSRSSYALPLCSAIKWAARCLRLFAPRSWKCNCWELRNLRKWRRRRLGRSERCDQAAIARLFLSPAASCLENNFFNIKKGEKKSSRPPLTPSSSSQPPLTCERIRGGCSAVGAAPPSPGCPGPPPPAAPMHPFYTRAATMIGEIAAAVSFISKFLRTKGLTSERQLQTFSQSLQELLAGEWATEGGRGAPVGCGSRAAANGGSRPGFGGWTEGAPSPLPQHDWQTEG